MHLKSREVAANSDERPVWEVPGVRRTFASACLGALPGLPQADPRAKPADDLTNRSTHASAASRTEPPEDAETGAVVSAAAETTVWQLRPREPNAGAVRSPDAVSIPEGSVLLLGDATRGGASVEFAAVRFTGAAPWAELSGSAMHVQAYMCSHQFPIRPSMRRA